MLASTKNVAKGKKNVLCNIGNDILHFAIVTGGVRPAADTNQNILEFDRGIVFPLPAGGYTSYRLGKNLLEKTLRGGFGPLTGRRTVAALSGLEDNWKWEH
jgi:hypothetical protein